MREIKYQVYIDKDVEYVGGKMWAVAGMSWREYIDDGEPENPIRKNVVDLDICDIEDFEKQNYTKTAWQGKYIKDKFHLREYTGLKDKNGKEIYEGDIVMHPKFGTYKIINEYGGFGIKVKALMRLEDGFHSFATISADYENCEIIGNIYEDEHLLTQKP